MATHPPNGGPLRQQADPVRMVSDSYSRVRAVLGPVAMLMLVAAIVAIGFFLWWTDNLDLGTAGLAGVWIVSFIGAASLVVPVPGLAAVCFAAAPGVGYNPLVVAVIAGSAEAIGEMTGYMAGASGRSLLRRNRYYPRLRLYMSKWGGPVLFFGSAIPNPLFDVLGLLAGSVSYPVRRFIPIVFVGKTIKSSMIAYGCLYGVGVVEWIVDAA